MSVLVFVVFKVPLSPVRWRSLSTKCEIVRSEIGRIGTVRGVLPRPYSAPVSCFILHAEASVCVSCFPGSRWVGLRVFASGKFTLELWVEDNRPVASGPRGVPQPRGPSTRCACFYFFFSFKNGLFFSRKVLFYCYPSHKRPSALGSWKSGMKRAQSRSLFASFLFFTDVL